MDACCSTSLCRTASRCWTKTERKKRRCHRSRGHVPLSSEMNHEFIHFAVCPNDGSIPLPKRVHHKVRSRASSFNFQYPCIFLRLFNGCLSLHPRITATFPSLSLNNVFYKAVPTQDVTNPFRLPSFLCRMFLFPLSLYNTSSFLTRSVQQISILLQRDISELSRYF